MPSRKIQLDQHSFPSSNQDVDALISGVPLPTGFLARMRALAQRSQRAEALRRAKMPAGPVQRLVKNTPDVSSGDLW